METEDLRRLIDLVESGGNMSVADAETVERLEAEYPFFTLPDAMLLKAGALTDEQTRRLKARIALNAPDAETLMRLIDADGRKLASFYPEEAEPETPSTQQALDTFLDNYGDPSTDSRERQLLERLIFNPVPQDYASTLVADEPMPAPVSEQDQLLAAFLEKQGETQHAVVIAEEPQPPEPMAAKAADASDPLSESLAKIYIKQRRYDKAYEIISKLNLNFPKKSAYFADQLRFLQKLILLQNYSKSK